MFLLNHVSGLVINYHAYGLVTKAVTEVVLTARTKPQIVTVFSDTV